MDADEVERILSGRTPVSRSTRLEAEAVAEELAPTEELYPTSTAGVRKLARTASAMVREVRAGRHYIITCRGKPVAHLVPDGHPRMAKR